MTEYYYLIADYGDGSYGVHWFKSKELAERLVDEDEQYWGNEGTVNTILAIDLQARFRDSVYE